MSGWCAGADRQGVDLPREGDQDQHGAHEDLSDPDAVPRHAIGYRVDHPDRRAALHHVDREHGAQPGLVRHCHRYRRRDRPFDTATWHILLCHQIQSQ